MSMASSHDGDNTSSSSSSPSHVLVMAGQNPEEWPHLILRGQLADLAPLRHVEAHPSFFVGPRSPLLVGSSKGIACRVHWPNEDQDDASYSVGDVYLTQSQVLFVAKPSGAESEGARSSLPTPGEEHDWAIGATCIHLHAMTEEPEVSIYLQLSGDGSNDDDDQSTMEVTLTPVDPESCQQLFDGLCKLVAKHPVQLDDEDDNGPGLGGGDFFMGGRDGNDMVWAPAVSGHRAGGLGAIIPDYDDDDDDMGAEDEDGNSGATEEERSAMLERLDNLLVIRPGLEAQEGQFDDADEVDDEVEEEDLPQ